MKNVMQIINEGFERELGIEESCINRNFELVEKLLNEGGTYRIYTHLKEDDKWAIVSPYRNSRTKEENKAKMRDLKAYVKKKGYGYTELKSVWSETNPKTGEVTHDNEYSLLIYNMGRKEAMKLGADYNQSSVIVKEGDTISEICTTPFETSDGKNASVGEVVRTFNVDGDKVLNIETANAILSGEKDGSASVPTQGGGRPFSMKSESLLESVFEVEPPRASYFRNKEVYIPLYKRKK